MPNYCCFWCPRPSSPADPTNVADPCPTCGRNYDTPLRDAPLQVDKFRVIAPIARGFYGVTYRAKHEALGTSVVLKVVPKSVYEALHKSWTQECQLHASLQEETQFIARITDSGEASVDFGSERFLCHFAVLEDITGPTLAEVLAAPREHDLTSRRAAQIALDLLEILHTFDQREHYHNDLNATNIIVHPLTSGTQRSDGFHPFVRAVAVDLGSVLDQSRSGGSRFGDQVWIAKHVANLARAVRSSMTAGTDEDFRITEALQGLAEHLTPAASAQRVMGVADARQMLGNALARVEEPWRQPLVLTKFDEAYNAQVLQSWHVPDLWWDPDGRWLRRTTGKGPQVITGMRGCGKTILLRALHFHARARAAVRVSGSDPANRLQTDPWVGIYASCQQLLNPQDSGAPPGHLPFERLFLAYVKDSIGVLRHVESLDRQLLINPISDFVAQALKPLTLRDSPEAFPTPAHAYRALTELQFQLGAGGDVCKLRTSPGEAFGHLGEALTAWSQLFANKYVLFLLDDVSTRFLDREMVGQVISQLLFQHPGCAFRLTTEAQTLHRVLLSPGGTAPADPSRDYDEFDLGGEVYRLLQESKGREGRQFISEVLKKRGQHMADSVSPLYRMEPIHVLGDLELESIAQTLGQASEGAPERKRAYHGLRALEAVCVGDIGDVMKLYDRILQRAPGGPLPIDAAKQSDAFLQHSSSLVHHLNRKDQSLKDLAIAFARSAGELLKRSARSGSGRLRQYTKLYVRVEPGPRAEQVASRIWDLLDNAVFVYDGGAPRTKTRDADPVLQFKLSYRKLLGLASFIGLADRDRFELSGSSLETFLSDPREAERVLLDSQVRTGTSEEMSQESGVDDEHHDEAGEAERSSKGPAQESPTPVPPAEKVEEQLDLLVGAPSPQSQYVPFEGARVRVAGKQLSTEGLRGVADTRLILARGFEERTAESARRITSLFKPTEILLVDYDPVPQGVYGDEVISVIDGLGIPRTRILDVDALRRMIAANESPCVIDSTGMSKPFLFAGVHAELRERNRAVLVHTLAESYYPRNEDLEGAGVRGDGAVSSETFNQLGSVLTGEAGPYRLQRVHSDLVAPERARILIASASPKNDRLSYLLENRGFDATFILVPPPTSPRRRVARASAELAATAADVATTLVEVETNDLEGALREVERLYRLAYFSQGASVEFGLTGSKVHAIAFAAVAAAGRASYAWYVSPSSFDLRRYTTGVGETHCMQVELTSPAEWTG